MRIIPRYLVSGALLVGVWKLLSMALSTVILPPPEQAFTAFGMALFTAGFWQHFAASTLRVAGAMAIALSLGFPMGLTLGHSRRIDRILSPFVFLTYPVPKIVLLPVFLVLFGLGDFSKIFMIALIVGYQIVVATRDAVRGLNKKYLDSFRSLSGSRLQLLAHVLVPAALPGAFTALRIGTGTGIAVLFFVESFATPRGLGYLIMDAWGRFAYNHMFVGILGMSLLGVVLYETVNILEKTICGWKYLESGRDDEMIRG